MHRLAVISCLFLASCGGSGPLSLLTGGGPNVAANVQAGAENTQQAVANQSAVEAGRDVVTTKKQVEAARVETITVTNDRIPPWVLLIGLIGWLLPTPSQMGESIGRGAMWLFRRRK